MTFRLGPSDIRRAQGAGPSARKGWGLSTIRMGGVGQTLTLEEGRRRIASLRTGVKDKASAMLMAAAIPLKEKWKDNIAAEGWTGTAGFEQLHEEDEEVRWSSMRLEKAGKPSSTGRYYNSIEAEVDSQMEVHVGSTIPRPSGRGLRRWSYPEALELGFVHPLSGDFIQIPTLRPAIDEVGDVMEKKTMDVFSSICDAYLMGKPGYFK
jgi:hypothetical protein